MVPSPTQNTPQTHAAQLFLDEKSRTYDEVESKYTPLLIEIIIYHDVYSNYIF